MEPLDSPVICHPVVAVLDRLAETLGELSATSLMTLDAASTAATLERLTRLSTRLAATTLSVLAHGDEVDVAGPSGAVSTATWLAHATKATRTDAFSDTRLAVSLAQDKHRCLAAAVGEGRVRVDQARVIVSAVDRLPVDGDFALAPELIAHAEAHLVGLTVDHDGRELRRLGNRLLEVVSPETADAYEAAVLAASEVIAAESTRMTMSEDGHGSVFVRAKLPAAQAAMLKKVLLAYAAPRRQAAVAAQDGVPTPARQPSPQRMGRGFCELIETLSGKDHPNAGGTGATVVVTMDYSTLLGGIKAAQLDTGETISPGQARRLACQAGIVPAVVSSDSVPLDLGRTQRSHTRAQRIAVALRDKGCTADGCDWPPGMCHVHHDPPWSEGGVTDVEHARMLCPHHHARAHDPAYDITMRTDGRVSFHRRC